MDLRGWIREQHDGIRLLLQSNILDRVPREKLAVRPSADSNSIAWLLWHIARCEDVAVNAIVRGQPQLLLREQWGPRLGFEDARIGTAFGDEEVGDLGRRLDLDALLQYWEAVSQETRSWLEEADLEQLDWTPDVRERLGAAPPVVPKEGDWLLERWSGQPARFFLRMTVIGHEYLHLGEMMAIRGQLGIRGL